MPTRLHSKLCVTLPYNVVRALSLLPIVSVPVPPPRGRVESWLYIITFSYPPLPPCTPNLPHNLPFILC